MEQPHLDAVQRFGMCAIKAINCSDNRVRILALIALRMLVLSVLVVLPLTLMLSVVPLLSGILFTFTMICQWCLNIGVDQTTADSVGECEKPGAIPQSS